MRTPKALPLTILASILLGSGISQFSAGASSPSPSSQNAGFLIAGSTLAKSLPATAPLAKIAGRKSSRLSPAQRLARYSQAVHAAQLRNDQLVKAAMAGPNVAPLRPAPQSLARAMAELRQCESSGNYADNTGNGYYGAYQFDLGTWRGLGLSGLPSSAAPEVQDRAAATLQSQRGWSPWPACSAHLGL
ncbi:MAG: transglycosylase family protein [Actinomycetota bacterium]